MILGVVLIGALVFRKKAETAAQFSWPIQDHKTRPKLLTFGLYVTPDPSQNPIDPPERFTGYHTALDIETFDHESDIEIPIYAACDGQTIFASTAEGYGGVVIQRCDLNGEAVTVLYGHLDPQSFSVQERQYTIKGSQLATLAEDKSIESGLTRKHLHFGIHKGPEIELRGYVKTEEELSKYIDPLTVLPD